MALEAFQGSFELLSFPPTVEVIEKDLASHFSEAIQVYQWAIVDVEPVQRKVFIEGTLLTQ